MGFENPSDFLAGGEPPVIPDHEMIRCFARGGFGELWLARNVAGTYRAVKVVYRHKFDHEKPYDREFQGLIKFEPVSRTHDGLMDVLQIGRNAERGYFYSVLELADDRVTGQDINPANYRPRTLGDTVSARQALPFDKCLSTMLALSSAVSHLHENGLIHRDIKPWNVIFVDGEIKVADIGLVTNADTESIGGGTIGYMAPEGAPSKRADVYSLGKVLYELSTGKDRQEFPELPTIFSRQEDRAKLSELNEIFLKACDQNPAKRYESATELHSELALLAAGKSIKRLRQLERRMAWLSKAAIVVAVCLVLGALGYYRETQERKRETRRLADSFVATGTRFATEGDLAGAVGLYAQALQADQGDEPREDRDRVLIGTSLRQCPRPIQLFFHDAEIKHVQFSPDEKRVVTACAGGEVAIWNIEDGSKLLLLPGRGVDVYTACFSPDGNRILVASKDGTAQILDIATREQVALFAHPAPVLSARFNHEGNRVVTAGQDRIIRLWDLAGGPPLELEPHDGPVRDAAFSPDGTRVVGGSEDGTARIFDLASGASLPLAPPRLRSQPNNWVTWVDFSPEGRRIVTGGLDGAGRIWDLKGQNTVTLPHARRVGSVAFSADGRYVLTACDDHTARLWDTGTGKEVIPPLTHNSPLRHAALNVVGNLIATATTEGVCTIWNLAIDEWYRPDPVFFTRQGNRFAALSGRTVHLRDAASSSSVCQPLVSSNDVHEVHLNADGSRLVLVDKTTNFSGQVEFSARLWGDDGQPLAPPFVCPRFVVGISQSGERMVVVASLDNSRPNLVHIWDTREGKIVSGPFQHRDEGWRAVLSPDGSRLITFDRTNGLLWATTSNAPLGMLVARLPHSANLSHAEFSRDGRLLVTACTDNGLSTREAQVWDSVTGSKIGSPLKHPTDGLAYAGFSPDGTLVVTAGEDHATGLWPVNGKGAARRLLHRRGVDHAAFSVDGRRLVTISDTTFARVWDVESGLSLTPPLRHPWTLWHARFVGNNQRLLAKRLKGDLWRKDPTGGRPYTWQWKLWDLSPDPRPAEDLVSLARLLSGHEYDAAGNDLPLKTRVLREIWELLRARYPSEFRVTPAQGVAWHQREAQSADNDGDWQASWFHLQRLLVLTPSDPWMDGPLERVERHLGIDVRNLKP